MTALKSQIKISTIDELGNKYDDMREAVEKDIHRKEGFHAALNEVQQSTLKSIFERVDADRDAGKLDLEASGIIKEYLAKVHAALDNLRIMTEKQRLIAEGRAVGLKEAIQFAKKLRDAEHSKLVDVQPAEVAASPLGEARPDRVPAVADLNSRRSAPPAAQVLLVEPPAPAKALPSSGRKKASPKNGAVNA